MYKGLGTGRSITTSTRLYRSPLEAFADLKVAVGGCWSMVDCYIFNGQLLTKICSKTL